MKYLRRLVPIIIALFFLLANGCAPPPSGSGGGSSSGGGGGTHTTTKAGIQGKLIVPNGVAPKQARTMYAALSGDVLPGATVVLSDADGTPFDTTVSDVKGEYLFDNVDPGNNYLIHANLGNINLYGLVPFVNDVDVDVGQIDAASTAVYLLAQYYVNNDPDFTSIADVDVGALETYLELNIALVNEVVQALVDFGDTNASSGDIIDNVNNTVVTAAAAAANDTAISITASKEVLTVNEEFFVYVNAGFVTDLYGASFGLEYDSTKIQVKDSDLSDTTIQPTYAQGDFFDSAASNLLVGFENGDYDKLLVGISKTGQVVGNDGNGNLLRITFKALDTTSSTILCFDSTSMITDSSDNEIPTNSWADVCKEISIQ